MNSIERRVERIEAKANAQADDLTLLSDEELNQRASALAQRMLSNQDETIEAFLAMPADAFNRLAARFDVLESELRGLLEAAIARRAIGGGD